MVIRPIELADADQIDAMLHDLRPYNVSPPGLRRRRLEQSLADPRCAGWVAESDGELIGWGTVTPTRFRDAPETFQAGVIVRPEYRRQGIGSALADLIKEHLGTQTVRELHTMADTEGVGFAVARGGVAGDVTRLSGARLDNLPEQPAVPAGTSIVPLTELDPQDVHPLFAATVREIPGFEDGDISYDGFLNSIWDVASGNSRELGAAALVDGTVRSMTLVVRDRTSLWTNLTVTSPEYRGRGLSRLVKWFSLSWAAEHGCTMAYTANSTENAPMLAVNTWFGYQPAASATMITWRGDTDL
jgi:GNAT superfamily N-acetyltransferase